MNSVIQMLQYAQKHFIGRDTQLTFVRKKAEALRSGDRVERRTIIFTGERAIGKSWLLQRLAELLAELGFTVFRVDLKVYANKPKTDKPDEEVAIANILLDLHRVWGEKQSPGGASLAELSRNVLEVVRKHLPQKPLTVCVDHVYESNWELLAALEEYVLGPLAIEPRVLMILAGRGRLYPFKTPELRLKVDTEELRPFSLDETIEQLQVQHEARVPLAEKIHAISGGNPGANDLLAQHPEEPAQALNEVLTGMLEPVPPEQRQKVREYLEALCVLNAFDEERIPPMFAEYYVDPAYKNWTYAQARQARELLTESAFARWDADRGGYVLHDMPRKLLEQYLRESQLERWKSLQNEAKLLYNKWVGDYPRNKERWQEEVTYHNEQLNAVQIH